MAAKLTRPYRVMEYLNDDADFVIGWVFLEPAQYEEWKNAPRSWSDYVIGYCMVAGFEECAELGSIPCARMWDYFHTIARRPGRSSTIDEAEEQFE